jgi:hypothetical protein
MLQHVKVCGVDGRASQTTYTTRRPSQCNAHPARANPSICTERHEMTTCDHLVGRMRQVIGLADVSDAAKERQKYR